MTQAALEIGRRGAVESREAQHHILADAQPVDHRRLDARFDDETVRLGDNQHDLFGRPMTPPMVWTIC